MRLKRIGLFAPQTNYYYQKMLAFAKGFQKCGLDTYVGPVLLLDHQKTTFCREWKPDIIFELNNDKGPGVPKDVFHINWLQDYDFNAIKVRSTSDLTYFVIPPRVAGYPFLNDKLNMLHTGFDPDVFYPNKRYSEKCIFSFCGFLPPPQSREKLISSIFSHLDIKPKVRDISIHEIIEAFKKQCRQSDANYFVTGQKVNSLISSCVTNNFEIGFNKLKGLLEYDILRTMERKSMLDMALKATKKIHIYGPEPTWTKWYEYDKYYQCHLPHAHEIRKAHCGSRAILHSGNWGLGHWRTMEAMGCGRPVMIQDLKHDLLKEEFRPMVDYIPWTHDSFKSVARWVIKNPRKASVIGRRGREKALKRHTWYHRAKEVLQDVKKAI